MRVVILGAGYAGLMCALRLAGRARHAREAIRVTLVADADRFVNRIRLHETAAGRAEPAVPLDAFIEGTDIERVTGRVVRVDPAAGEVHLLDGRRLAFDRAVLALGSRVDRDAVAGIREHAFTLDAASAEALAAALPPIAARGGRLVVIGGGLTAIEGATEIADAHPGLAVTLLTGAPLGDGLSPAAQTYLRTKLASMGIAVREGVRVSRLVEGGAELHGAEPGLAAETVPFDACLWAGGFVAGDVARASGLPVNAIGQIRVDERLHVIGHDTLYAIGDAAAPVDPPAPIRMGCKTAMPMGAQTADNLARAAAGKQERPFSYADTVFCISLGRHDGLVQPYRKDGTPTNRPVTGRAGALIKEAILRYVPAALHMERRGIVTGPGARPGLPWRTAAPSSTLPTATTP